MKKLLILFAFALLISSVSAFELLDSGTILEPNETTNQTTEHTFAFLLVDFPEVVDNWLRSKENIRKVYGGGYFTQVLFQNNLGTGAMNILEDLMVKALFQYRLYDIQMWNPTGIELPDKCDWVRNQQGQITSTWVGIYDKPTWNGTHINMITTYVENDPKCPG